jgi:quercetin dioxygenase-like cupin family protein
MGQPHESPVVVGNAAEDATSSRGWFIGHFLGSEAGPRQTAAVEVKWALHAAGERRHAWAVSRHATALAVLIRGRFRFAFRGGHEVVLAREGDYVLWPAGIAHTWEAESETLLLTLRWPSAEGDAIDLDPVS